MTDPITLVGNGAMATVVASILNHNGARVTVLTRSVQAADDLTRTRENAKYLPGLKLSESIAFTVDPAEALASAGLVVSAIPTQHIREVWSRIGPHLRPGVPVASVAKGVETGTLLRPTQVISQVLTELGRSGDAGDHPDRPARPMASISGPTIAEELARCLPATVTAASDSEPLARRLQQQLTTSYLRVYTHSDLLGVELAGATKNVIAIAAGILDGLQAGVNAKSALLTRGLAEIARLGVAMGASRDTFFGLSGVGDLATTCFSPSGRNRRCGEQLGRGRKLQDVLSEIPGIVEGVPTTRAVLELAQRYRVEMPITAAIHRVLFDGLDPIDAIGLLMTRDLKSERVG